MKSNNVLTEFQQSLPNYLKTRIVKLLIAERYTWLNDPDFVIDDSFMPDYVKKLKAHYRKDD